jgi:3-methyladenine DNA glycosylase AlkC
MAEPLINQYGPEVPALLAERFQSVYADFPAQQFLSLCLQNYDSLGLMARGQHMAKAMAQCLPADFMAAADIVQDALAEPLITDQSFAMASFVYLPHGFFVANEGITHHERSMTLLHAITQRFTSEFAIRRFLLEQPEATLKVLASWCQDSSEHVRRLVSEGTRPRLPWAARLPAFQADPTPVISLLEQLKDDTSSYVRRSVANNLNDISKDHPQRVLDLAEAWLVDADDNRRALVRHGLRSLIKAGDAQALALMGFVPAAGITLAQVSLLPAAPRRGEHLQISCELINQNTQAQSLCVDLRIHYLRQNGRYGIKVFKWKTLTLAAGESSVLSYRLSLADMTTRRHYEGRHLASLLVNGEVFDLGEFELRPAD